MKYVHTNVIAKDWKKLSQFYQKIFGCVPKPPVRDLKGLWVDSLTGMKDAHIEGEHLELPGYDPSNGPVPTIEIFTYHELNSEYPRNISSPGFAHIAFEVEDVKEVLEAILKEGGSQVGEVVTAVYPNQKTAVFVYARDIEGNIVELQSWS